MKNQANEIVELFIQRCQQKFPDRILSIYTLGSLGKHGDFSRCSDIDVAVLFDMLIESDAQIIKEIWEEIKAVSLPYAERLSVFWSSPEEWANGVGRFPALDRLDLINHAILQYGNDCREKLIKPTNQEVIKESAQFILDFMLTDEKKYELFETRDSIAKKGARYFTKFILFPVRLLYTISFPDEVVSNKHAVDYFIENHSTGLNQVVSLAYQCRNSEPNLPVNVESALFDFLPELYQECIQLYLEAVQGEQSQLANDLSCELENFN